jgi:WXG100 family type VII secretion target
MASSNLFQSDYEELDTIASTFNTLGSAVESEYNHLKQAVDNMREKWIGEGATKFFQEMEDEVLPGVQRLQAALEQGGGKIKGVAGQIREHEEQASALLKLDHFG